MNVSHPDYQTTNFGTQQGWQVAVVVPARDEEERIGACLDALAASLSRARTPGGQVAGGIVLVVNNTVDDTANVARRWWEAHSHVPGKLLDCSCHEAHAGVGWARRLGLDSALEQLASDRVLMTTDADALVEVDWIAANLAELERADLVCGTVLPIEAELSRLPDMFMRHGADEGEYMQAMVRLAAELDPLAHDPSPSHRNGAGASLAFSARLYRDVGGMPCLKVREDRAFVESAEARDWRIRYASTPVVRASCRLTGRASGGMATALRSRLEDDDPFCDEFLEPAATAIFRYSLKGMMRRAWPDRRRLAGLLSPLRLLASAPNSHYFGVFWQMVENSLPALKRVRLRQSDLPAQQRILSDWFANRPSAPENA